MFCLLPEVLRSQSPSRPCLWNVEGCNSLAVHQAKCYKTYLAYWHYLLARDAEKSWPGTVLEFSELSSSLPLHKNGWYTWNTVSHNILVSTIYRNPNFFSSNSCESHFRIHAAELCAKPSLPCPFPFPRISLPATWNCFLDLFQLAQLSSLTYHPHFLQCLAFL